MTTRFTRPKTATNRAAKWQRAISAVTDLGRQRQVRNWRAEVDVGWMRGGDEEIVDTGKEAGIWAGKTERLKSTPLVGIQRMRTSH